MVFGKSFILQDALVCNESSSAGCLPFHETKESNAFTCIDAKHYARIQTAEHNDGLEEDQSGAECRSPIYYLLERHLICPNHQECKGSRDETYQDGCKRGVAIVCPANGVLNYLHRALPGEEE